MAKRLLNLDEANQYLGRLAGVHLDPKHRPLTPDYVRSLKFRKKDLWDIALQLRRIQSGRQQDQPESTPGEQVNPATPKKLA
jgi:hypothetical protein